MRSLSPSNGKRFRTRTIGVIALLAEGAWTPGCAPGTVSSPPPPPPPLIGVTVLPASASVVLGNQATFTVTVTNTTDTAVSWSVNSVPGGNATMGTITSAGVYTAPADLPSPATVQITATSHADPNKIWHRQFDDYERHHAELDAESCERGTRRDASLSSHGNKQRASGYGGTLEPLRPGLR